LSINCPQRLLGVFTRRTTVRQKLVPFTAMENVIFEDNTLYDLQTELNDFVSPDTDLTAQAIDL
tara:strand:+ start:264 stop:455 length:192 start_codon:yes stop_codon:yes gene_type:complete